VTFDHPNIQPGVGAVSTPPWEELPDSTRETLDAEDGPIFEFVTGRAGSGKTFAMKARAQSRRGMVTCATTGIAAINIGGTTINSMLGFFDTDDLIEKFNNLELDHRIRHLRDDRGIRTLVVDEASMLAGEQFALIHKAFVDVNQHPLDNGHLNKVIRLALVGDFAQLPPVKARFAFEADAWEDFEANTVKLTKIRRQADVDFIEALNNARIGTPESVEAAAEFFADHMVPRRDDHFDGCTIVAKNDEVERFNWTRLNQLQTPKHTFVAKRFGRPRSEWKQIPDRLEIKEGAKVMVLANVREDIDLGGGLTRKGDFLYVNGDLGEFLGTSPGGHAVVKLDRTDKVVQVVPTFREFKTSAEKEEERLQKKYKVLTSEEVDAGKTISDLDMGEIEKRLGGANSGLFSQFLGEREGGITYMPLRVAYASTVHKSQGLSLDKVQVALTGTFMANPGSVYVALSRARTLEGLRLVGDVDMFIRRCKSDERVRRFL
jgi:ATP-dependent DNA helicase PIF1